MFRLTAQELCGHISACDQLLSSTASKALGTSAPLLPGDRAALLTLRSRFVQRVGAGVLAHGGGERLQRLLAAYYRRQLARFGRAAEAARRRAARGDGARGDAGFGSGGDEDDGSEEDGSEEDESVGEEGDDAMDTCDGNGAPAELAEAPGAAALSAASGCLRALGLQVCLCVRVRWVSCACMRVFPPKDVQQDGA